MSVLALIVLWCCVVLCCGPVMSMQEMSVSELDEQISGLDRDIEMAQSQSVHTHSGGGINLLLEARSKLIARRNALSDSHPHTTTTTHTQRVPPRINAVANARRRAVAAKDESESASESVAFVQTHASVEAEAAAAAAVEARLNALAAAQFHGIRTEREKTAADTEPNAPHTGPTVVIVSTYLAILLGLGTCVLGAALGWMSCKCVDSCRSPNYI